MQITMQAIGHVRGQRPTAEDDFWGGEQLRIVLAPEFGADALQGLGQFMAEFLPRDAVRQPAWAGELMRDYWATRG